MSPSSSSNTDSPAASPYPSYTGEPWSPASVSPELDDDYSLASSTTSLSPISNLDTFLGEPENNDSFFSNPEVSPGADSIYQPLIEQYPSFPHERHDYLLNDDEDLSPLTFHRLVYLFIPYHSPSRVIIINPTTASKLHKSNLLIIISHLIMTHRHLHRQYPYLVLLPAADLPHFIFQL